MTTHAGAIDPRFPAWPLLLAAGLTTIAGGALAIISPPAAIGMVILMALVGLIVNVRNHPIARLAPPFVAALVVAALLGPNLAIPQAPGVFLFRVMIVALGAGALGFLLVGGRIRYPRAISLPAALLGTLIVWTIMSIAWSENPSAAVRWTVFFSMMAGLSIVIPMAFTTRRRVIQLLIVLGATFAAVTLLAFLEVAFDVRLPTSRLAGQLGATAFAATSVFGNENNFATYLTLTLPYLVSLSLVFRDRRLRILGVVGTAADLVALLFTGSKDNLVAAGLVFLTLLLFLATDPKQRGKLVGAILIGIVAIAVVVPSLNGTGVVPLPQKAVDKFSFTLLQKEISTGSGSGAARASLLGDGIRFVGDTGGFGVGAGNAETHVLNLPDFPGVSNMHDWWLEVAVDLGLIGLALYVTFYLFLVTRQLRAARRAVDPLIRYLGLAGTASLIGFVLGSLGPSTMIAFAPMWVTFGLAMMTISIADRARHHGGLLP